MATQQQKLKAVRKKLYDDFEFYSKAALQIRTKTGEIAPLKLNPAQEILTKLSPSSCSLTVKSE